MAFASYLMFLWQKLLQLFQHLNIKLGTVPILDHGHKVPMRAERRYAIHVKVNLSSCT